MFAICSLFTLPNRAFEMSRYGRSDRHHREIQPGERRPRRSGFSLHILPAEGHLFDLLEPEDVMPEWKRWSPILLRPEGLYGTRPAEGGNKAAKLRAIREALRTAKGVWLATDCDREVNSSVRKFSSITSTAGR